MKKDYRYTKTTISDITYHFVFCPRYRRKIFLIPGVEESFRELVKKACENNDIKLLALRCNPDHVCITLNALPNWSCTEIMRTIKESTSAKLREEFPALSAMPSLWTRNYLVSTEDIMPEDTTEYVNTQKNRP